MFETVVVVSLFVALLMAGRRTQEDPDTETIAIEPAGDLPCPWCLGPTREEDRSCPGCGQRFG